MGALEHSARRPVSFLATDDADGTAQFYGQVLGLKLIDRSDFALVFLDGDHSLRIQIVETLTPAPFTAHGWEVGDIDTQIAELSANGVETLRFDGLEQSEAGVWTSPAGAKIAWFTDPSGNILSLTQF